MKNHVILMGYPRDLVVDSEKQQATFKLVVNEDEANQNGEHRLICNTFDCVCKLTIVKDIAKNIKEVSYTIISGKLRSNDYEDAHGYTHTHTWIQVESINK